MGNYFSPETFDALLGSDRIPLDKVHACSMMTLGRFDKDMRWNDMFQDHWIRQCPPETHYEPRSFLRWKWTKERKLLNPAPHVRDNREYFRWQMGFRDALQALNPEAAIKIFSVRYARVLYLNRKHDSAKPLRSRSDLKTLIIDANTHPQYQISEADAEIATDLLFESLTTLEAINAVLKESQRRQGVQVIYGANDFPSYLSSFGDSIPQGDTPYGLCLPARIPMKYVTAVVPIGAYEQEKLLKP